MKKVLQIVLAIAFLTLGYLLYDSIMKPIHFERARKVRYKSVVAKLKRIRKAQQAYKDVKSVYSPNFNELISFVKNDSFPVVKAIGTIPEEFIDSLKSRKKAEALALKKGLISRDTIRISINDSLFKNYDVDTLRYVPFTNKAEFEMDTAQVTASGLPVKVFEAKVLNTVLLHGLDERLIATFNDGKDYPGLKVGSLTEANNNAGNWE